MTSRNTPSKDGAQGSAAASYVLAFIAFAASQGVSEGPLLQRTGLSPKELADENSRVPIDQYLSVIRSAQSMTTADSLPIRFAAQLDFSAASIAGLIANAAPTMLDSLKQLSRYGQLALDVPFRGSGALEFVVEKNCDIVVDTRNFDGAVELIETALTLLITGPRRFLPSSHVIEATVCYPKPEHHSVYAEVWKCPVRFNAEQNSIRVYKWVAGYPVGLLPDYALAVLQRHADEMLARQEKPSSFSTQLETLISSSLHTGDVSINWVAKNFGVSRQTVYRKLRAEGVTFSEVLDTVRHRLAVDYLSSREVTVEELAGLLGFADASPFSRAFKRWTGASPGRFYRGV